MYVRDKYISVCNTTCIFPYAQDYLYFIFIQGMFVLYIVINLALRTSTEGLNPVREQLYI